MDKKLTKEDIIKVAKCCIADNCVLCPLAGNGDCITDFMKHILEYMKNEPAPTADMQEIKRGKQFKPSNDLIDSKQWICSECKGLTETAYYCEHCYYNYCPNCGAKMEEFEE